GRANPIPGHNIPYAVLGTIILWFGRFGFNPGATLSVDFAAFGYFPYVARTTNGAVAAGAVAGVAGPRLEPAKPAISIVPNGAFVFGTSFGCLWVLNKVWGIRVGPAVESQGRDVHEHGMWGYPEFYIPVPGGYGTESHGHLGLGRHHEPKPVPVPVTQEVTA